ncbi:hypothetical protein HOY80DRAFT_1024064 [Tuber brumale]|nr:hypothetical protein HOY80DRAFT_1024064 [Tuber brumale]
MTRRGSGRVVNEHIYESRSVIDYDSFIFGYIFCIIAVFGAALGAIVEGNWYAAAPRTTERSFDALGDCSTPFDKGLSYSIGGRASLRMPVETIGQDAATARRQHRKECVFGAVTYADASGSGEETPQQGPPALNSQQEYPPLGGSKRPVSTPGSARSVAARSQPKSVDPEPIRSEPMYLAAFGGRTRPEPPQQLYPAQHAIFSGSQAPIGQTLREGFGEFNSLNGGPTGAKGKGKAPDYQSQNGAVFRSTLNPNTAPYVPASQQSLYGLLRAGLNSFSSTPIPPTSHHTPLNSQNQILSLSYLNSMASLPTPTASRPEHNPENSSLPNNPTAAQDKADSAVYQNAVLVAGAQKEHEKEIGGHYGQNPGISSTNPDGHYVCGRVLQDMKVRNAELRAQIEAGKAREEGLKNENHAIKDHYSTMEATLLSVGPQRAIPLEDFTKMMGEMAHLRAIAEQTQPMVETVNGYQQEIAVLRARLLANGIDPSINATLVAPAPRASIAALLSAIQETPVSMPVAVLNSVEPEEDNGRFPSNKFFHGEFGILFRSIANLGRCNYQFTRQMPVTNVQVPPQVREKLKTIVQGNEPLLDWLLDDSNKTKFLLVSGLFARLICNEVVNETFVDQLILKMGEAPSQKIRILNGWVGNNPDITNKVWPVLEKMSEALGEQLHDKYVSLLSRPTDVRHLEESRRSLVGCIEHAGRLALGMVHLGWGNWRFVFHGTATRFQTAKMTVCDLGTEGLLNFGHDTRILEERESKIKFCVFPMIYRRDNTGAWKVLAKATVLV